MVVVRVYMCVCGGGHVLDTFAPAASNQPQEALGTSRTNLWTETVASFCSILSTTSPQASWNLSTRSKLSLSCRSFWNSQKAASR